MILFSNRNGRTFRRPVLVAGSPAQVLSRWRRAGRCIETWQDNTGRRVRNRACIVLFCTVWGTAMSLWAQSVILHILFLDNVNSRKALSWNFVMSSQFQFATSPISVFSIPLIFWNWEFSCKNVSQNNMYLNFPVLQMRIVRPSERKCHLEAELEINTGFLFLSPDTFLHLYKNHPSH